MTTVTINGKKVLCSSVSLSGKKSLDAKPSANIDGPTEVQTLAFENMKISINNVMFPFTSTDLADTTLFHYSDLLEFYKEAYTGSNSRTLVVQFGKDGLDHTLEGLNSTSGIPVVMESFTFPVNVRDSKNAYMVNGSIILMETD